LASQSPRTSAERGAHHELRTSVHESDEREVRDVRARDEQHERRCREQENERLARRSRQLFEQRLGAQPEAARRRVALGVIGVHRRGDGPEVGTDCVEVDAGARDGKERQRARTFRRVSHASDVRNGHDETGMYTSFSLGNAGSGGSTPITVCRRSVISTVFSDDRRVAAESFAPVAVSKHEDGVGTGLVLTRAERAPQQRRYGAESAATCSNATNKKEKKSN
jgi:hypothetical protein